MPLEALCPAPATWRITAIASEQDRIVLSLEPRRNAVSCPVCATPSRRVHSRYRRTPWDLPWGRRPVPRLVHARRFFCDVPTCPRQIFAEPFPRVLARYARHTERLRQALLELAHASSAEMGARLARWLGYMASPDTLIRLQRREPFVFPAPRILGVDEFALRRGLTYGTLLVDLERRQPVAVLEGRTIEPLITWLQDHPANVSEALKALLHSRRWHPPATGPQPERSPHTSASPPISPAATSPKAPQPTPRKRDVWEAVQQRLVPLAGASSPTVYASSKMRMSLPRVTVILDEEAAANLAHKQYYKRVLEMTSRITPDRLW